jgi:hypothetical protein
MSRLSFIGIGDLHFDKMAKIFPDTHHTIVCKEVQKAADFARQNGIKHIIQYGDVCETPTMSAEKVDITERRLRKMSNKTPEEKHVIAQKKRDTYIRNKLKEQIICH